MYETASSKCDPIRLLGFICCIINSRNGMPHTVHPLNSQSSYHTSLSTGYCLEARLAPRISVIASALSSAILVIAGKHLCVYTSS